MPRWEIARAITGQSFLLLQAESLLSRGIADPTPDRLHNTPPYRRPDLNPHAKDTL